MELAYVSAGTGPAFVLVHAFPLNSEMWAKVLGRMSLRNRIVTPDMRGFGRSAPAASATMDEMADDVVELMDRLGLKKAAIGGCSMGGYVALAVWRRHPERVSGLVLIDTRAPGDTAEGKANRVTFAEAVKAGGAAVAVEKMKGKLLTAGALRSTQDLVETIILKNRPEGIAAALLGMGARADAMPTLPTITVPTLVLCGERDGLTPPADSKAIVEQVKGAKYVELPRAGHLSNFEAPGEFCEAVTSFLAALPPQ